MINKPYGNLPEPYPPIPKRVKPLRVRKPQREKVVTEKRTDKPTSGRKYVKVIGDA